MGGQKAEVYCGVPHGSSLPPVTAGFHLSQSKDGATGLSCRRKTHGQLGEKRDSGWGFTQLGLHRPSDSRGWVWLDLEARTF